MRVPVRYEWDSAKREQNLSKHGLAFNDAWQVYETPQKSDVPSIRSSVEWRRTATAFAPVAQAVSVLVYVARDGSVRCISFRRASRREREAYSEYLEENRQLHQ
jgi:uncharacterized DUF497 family protein